MYVSPYIVLKYVELILWQVLTVAREGGRDNWAKLRVMYQQSLALLKFDIVGIYDIV